jgi:hypothetical protein|tara:strand:+ start:431 stop:604 length:174 start_codon:yes stop_codon:yes gene_type:complete
MPAQIKMKLYNSNQNYILPATQNITQAPNVLMQSNTKRKCALLFLQGNKHCSSCSGK